MSIVGTRPPLISETNLYEPHHKAIILYKYYMIPVSKGQKAVRACTIRLLNLGHAKYEKVAIYAVNQRISNIWRIAGAA